MEAAFVVPLRRNENVPLDPWLVHGRLIHDSKGRDDFKRRYLQYAKIANHADLPFLMCTPTWRTNFERVRLAGANPENELALLRRTPICCAERPFRRKFPEKHDLQYRNITIY